MSPEEDSKKPPMLNELPEEEQQRILKENEAEFEAKLDEEEKSQQEIDNDARRLENAQKMRDMDDFTISRKRAKQMGMIVPDLPERVRQLKLAKARQRKADKVARRQRRINRLRKCA